jgi:tetratricopeptide (TPR) repeat protein
MKLEYAKALRDANSAISIDPDYPSAYVTRGVYYLQDKYKEALADFEK